ncbi:MAG: AbrB/MazE/SpoVT family DNA-binding domain-containing protein [Chloroflexi bacterium]|nr:AbrB/MazE/SpoVT family DNA-binding domain-containing protein [Chloroflexota bacterium]
MTSCVKVSNKNQIAIPAAVRRKLQIKGGDYLLVEARDGYVVLIPQPLDYGHRLRGLHREVWEGMEPQEYVRRERQAWRE